MRLIHNLFKTITKWSSHMQEVTTPTPEVVENVVENPVEATSEVVVESPAAVEEPVVAPEVAPEPTKLELLQQNYQDKASTYNSDAAIAKAYYEKILVALDVQAHFVTKGLESAASSCDIVVENLVSLMKEHLDNAKSKL